MSKWRCVNKFEGYCTEEPEFEGEKVMRGLGKDLPLYVAEAKCKNDAEHCMKFRYLSEIVDLSSLSESHLVETLTAPTEKSIKKVKKEKPVSQQMEF
jgi:hypothetical protein